MREIKLTVPKTDVALIRELAIKAEIAKISSHEVFIYGPNEGREELKIKTSNPKAKKFLAGLMASPAYKNSRINFSSHDIRALLVGESASAVTCPAYIPFTDIQQDLWQYSHITFSFITRIVVSGGLLAYAFLKDDVVLSIGAMIFTPFSPLILATAFGLVTKEKRLALQSVKAFLLGFLLTVGAASVVTLMAGGPLLFDRFGSLQTNLIISAVMGCLAAVADADDIGRRQLLGLAMAYPFVKFPIWIGISLVLGFPAEHVTLERFASLIGNGLLMIFASGSTYWVMARRSELRDQPE